MNKIILYTAGNEKSHKAAGEILRALKPGEYVIMVKRNRPIRSLDQNKFYWALMEIVATYAGHSRREVEFMFKMQRCFDVITYPNGKSIEIPRDTKDMDVAEFTVMLNNLQQWIRETYPALIIPRREDFTYAQYMNIQKNYGDMESSL